MRLLLFALVLGAISSTQAFAGEVARAIASVTAGFVIGITVTSGGSGYISEPAITIAGGGGSGATGKAILDGDKVSRVIVLTAGSGYAGVPEVTIDAPARPPGLSLEMVPKLMIDGISNSLARVEWSSDVSGPWNLWTNAVVTSGSTVFVDFSPASVQRFYRATFTKTRWGFISGSFTWNEAVADAGSRGLYIASWAEIGDYNDLENISQALGVEGWTSVVWTRDLHGKGFWLTQSSIGGGNAPYAGQPSLAPAVLGLALSIKAGAINIAGTTERKGYFYSLP